MSASSEPDAPLDIDIDLDDHDGAGPGSDYDPGTLRLRGRTRWASFAVGLITLLPYEVIEGHPQFIWHLIGELPPAGLLAYLAPLVAGLAVFALGLRTGRAASLAFGTLGALASAAVAVKLGADASAWEVMSLPDSLSQRVALPVLALALTGAGASLTFDERVRRVGHGLLLAGLGVAIAFYLWPGRGEAPARTLVRLVTSISDLPGWRYQVGYVLIGVLLAWPLLVATAALAHLKVPAPDSQPLATIVAQYGLPLMLGMLIFRSIPGGPEGWDVFTAVGSIAVLVGVVTLLTSAFEVAAVQVFAPDPELREGPGLPTSRAALVAAGALLAVGAAQAVIARPPTKGVEWAEGSATAEADALFDELLPQWNQARLRWDRRARGTTAAQALLHVKQRGRAVTEAAQAIDPALGAAVDALVRGARTLHVAGRTWHALIEGVNAACRRVGLPYYLDPSVIAFTSDGGRRRHFRMRSYRVEAVRRFEVAGRAFATLHVDRLDAIGPDQPLMGFSRDLQPFALVNLAEVRGFEVDLLDGASERPPSCGARGGLFARPAMATCGRVLARLVEGHREAMGPLAIALTDRHELQHQIDGPHLPMAGAVLEALGGRKSQRFMERVNRELSAYTAELTAPDSQPALGLVHLMRFVVSGRGHDVDHVARLVLGQMTSRWLYTESGDLDYGALTEAIGELADLDDATLRQRAAEAWAAFYTEPLAEVTEVSGP